MLVIANLRLKKLEGVWHIPVVPNCEVGRLGMNCLNTGTGTGGNLALCLFKNKSQREENTDYQKYRHKVTIPFKIKIVDDI